MPTKNRGNLNENERGLQFKGEIKSRLENSKKMDSLYDICNLQVLAIY